MGLVLVHVLPLVVVGVDLVVAMVVLVAVVTYVMVDARIHVLIHLQDFSQLQLQQIVTKLVAVIALGGVRMVVVQVVEKPAWTTVRHLVKMLVGAIVVDNVTQRAKVLAKQRVLPIVEVIVVANALQRVLELAIRLV